MAPLVVLQTSPRTAPGQLTAAAWRLLAGAAVVLATPGHAQTAVLALEDISIEPLEELDAAMLAGRLTARAAAEGGTVVWLAGPEGDPDLLARLDPRTVDVMVGSVDLAGARMLDLVAVMDRLRSPGGCPWDAAQTHASLLPYLLEETYETVEAVETGDRAELREELGDVLLQVVFHARMAAEHPQDPWDVDDVAGDIVDKLVRRHPHVFADGSADTAADVEAGWETLKRVEKGRTSAVDGVPLAQPALALAAKLMSRADKAGLTVPVPDASLPPARSDAEVGDLLLAVVARARAAGIDAEAALRSAARRYAHAIKTAESAIPPLPPT